MLMEVPGPTVMGKDSGTAPYFVIGGNAGVDVVGDGARGVVSEGSPEGDKILHIKSAQRTQRNRLNKMCCTCVHSTSGFVRTPGERENKQIVDTRDGEVEELWLS